MELPLLQWLSWPLKLAYVAALRPLVRLLTGNPRWPDPEPRPGERP